MRPAPHAHAACRAAAPTAAEALGWDTRNASCWPPTARWPRRCWRAAAIPRRVSERQHLCSLAAPGLCNPTTRLRFRRAAHSHIAGFPLHFDVPTLPGVVGRSGQGIQGADFECAGTVVPGKCAFAGPVSELLAATACSNALANKCRSAVVYTAGLDGCSDRLVLLKSANLAPSNSFVAPTVYTVERVEGASVSGASGMSTPAAGACHASSSQPCRKHRLTSCPPLALADRRLHSPLGGDCAWGTQWDS